MEVPSIPYGPVGIPALEADGQYYRGAAANIRHQMRQNNAFAATNLTEAVAKLCDLVAVELFATVALNPNASHTVTVRVPHISLAPNGGDPIEPTGDNYRDAATRIRWQAERGRAFAGSNLTEAVAKLCDLVGNTLPAADIAPQAKRTGPNIEQMHPGEDWR